MLVLQDGYKMVNVVEIIPDKKNESKKQSC